MKAPAAKTEQINMGLAFYVLLLARVWIVHIGIYSRVSSQYACSSLS